MFQGLKNLITHENIQKIKANQRYLSGEKQKNQSADSSEDYSLQNEISDRRNAFNVLTQSRHSHEGKYSLQKDYEREQIKKQMKEIAMLQQKVKINEEIYQRQLNEVLQKHQMELNALKIQLQKQQYLIKRHSKEEAAVHALKKDVKRLLQLHQQDQKTLENITHELTMAKRQNFQLKMTINKKQQVQAQQQAFRHTESQVEARLKQEIANLQKQKLLDHQRKKHLQQLVQRLRSENEELERQLQMSKMRFSNDVSGVEDKFKSQIVKLEEDNRELKKRNQMIEQSFIDHLTQTSLNLQLNLKSIPERSAKNNSTLYLQESPIRARSKDRQREDNHHLSDDDPEKRDNQAGKYKNQIKKLKSKLQMANEKIVELLKQKCNNRIKQPIK